MDKNRFLNYARYDLTIHAAFYRNMALLSTIIMLCLTLLGFLVRWFEKANDYNLWESDGLSYTHMPGTACVLCTAMGVMMMVYGACFNHPLANRQDRLKTLTLPATNGEKFLWHTLLVVVGGALQLHLSLLLCDALNAAFSLLCGFEKVYSLTASVWGIITVTNTEALGEFNILLSEIAAMRVDAFRVWISLAVMMVAAGVWELTAFVYGNSFKYRYNILWTMRGLWLLDSVVSVLWLGGISYLTNYGVDMEQAVTRDDAFDILTIFFWICDFLLISTAALMWWHSWVRYKRAQVTSWLNR